MRSFDPTTSFSSKPVEEVIEDNIEMVEKWDDMGLPDTILRGIYGYGYEIPSPIQKKAIRPIISGKDVIAQAQSGTGKTATFAIGSLSLLDVELKKPQIVCISPTRELSMQISTVFNGIGAFIDGLRLETFVGGVSVESHLHTLKNNPPHVVLGTAGRILDLLRRRALDTSEIKLFILDEADEMLSVGFREQVQSIFECFPETVQTCIFSATLPRHILDITDKFMNDPLRIIVKAEQLTLEGIGQYYVAVYDDVQKYETLVDLYGRFSMSHCIIYTNSVRRVKDLYQAMHTDKYPVCCIHSEMSKDEREGSLTSFRNGTYRVLISSNITARGIDIQQVSCVINFDVPKDMSTYLHRIGRSGRWGRKGVGINFITERDVQKLRDIEKFYCTQIGELTNDLTI